MEPVLSHISLFHFIRPWFLLSLIPAVLLFIFLWLRKPNYGSWHHVISPHLLPHLLQGTVKQQGKFPLVLLLVGWIIASFALAGPTWSKLPQTVQKKINAKVILLDLSLSMLAQDLKPSRLTRAQHKLSDILDQSKEGLTGLITYAGTSHVVSPLTDDTHTILSMVKSLSPEIMPIKGSNPVAAIEKAAQLLQQAGITEGQILLITDDVPADFVSKVNQFINPTLTPVSIFAIGTTEGAPIPLSKGSFVKDRRGAIIVPKLDIQRLKASAKALNGRFSTLSSDDEDINYLQGNESRLLNDEMKDTDRDFDTWNEHGLLLVVLLLPLTAIGYRKGWLSLFILSTLTSLLLAAPQSAEANPWNDLWSTKDQQGQQAWQNEQLEEASQLFNDPAWKASAQYKIGDYQSSSDTLKQHVTTKAGNTAENNYNLGNALAKQQDFPGALDAYEQALKLNPDMEDAKKNQSLVKKIEKQQQEQDGENKDADSKDGDSKQNDNSDEQQDKKDSDQQNGDKQDSEGEKSEQENQDQSDQKQNGDDQEPESESDKEQQSQQQSEQDSDDKKDKKQSQQQPEEDKKNDEVNAKEQQSTAANIQESNLDKEEQQALEQWLRRIPDDPGGLLRRKFSQESKLRRNQPVEDKQW